MLMVQNKTTKKKINNYISPGSILSRVVVIVDIFQMQVVLYKCGSSSQLNTCEYNSRWSFKDPLARMNEKNQFWTPIISTISPQLRFPLKKVLTFTIKTLYKPSPRAIKQDCFKGRYVMRNATLDLGNSTFLNRNLTEMEGFYWRVEMNLHVDKENVFCIILGTEVNVLKINSSYNLNMTMNSNSTINTDFEKCRNKLIKIP